jgi:hypothetical protein
MEIGSGAHPPPYPKCNGVEFHSTKTKDSNREAENYRVPECIILHLHVTYESVFKSFRTESIKKYTLTTINTRWEATQRVMVAKLTRLTHKIAIQLHLVVESCTIRNSRSRRSVRKLLDIVSYMAWLLEGKGQRQRSPCQKLSFVWRHHMDPKFSETFPQAIACRLNFVMRRLSTVEKPARTSKQTNSIYTKF